MKLPEFAGLLTTSRCRSNPPGCRRPQDGSEIQSGCALNLSSQVANRLAGDEMFALLNDVDIRMGLRTR